MDSELNDTKEMPSPVRGDSGFFLSPLITKPVRCTSTPLLENLQDFRLQLKKSFTALSTFEQPQCSSAYSSLPDSLVNERSGANLSIESSWSCPTADSGFASDEATLHHVTHAQKLQDRDIYNLKRRKLPGHKDVWQNCKLSSTYRLYSPGFFEGVEALDIVYHLSDRNLLHILSLLWSHLSLEDLGRIRRVSSVWQSCLMMDKAARERWEGARLYFENVNLDPNFVQTRVSLLKCSPRKSLSNVANIMASPNKAKMGATRSRSHTEAIASCFGSSTSPFKSAKLKLVKSCGANTLGLKGAALQNRCTDTKACPRCSTQAVVCPDQGVAVCPRQNCQFRFCARCLSAVHGSSPCAFPSSSRSYSSKSGIASRKSKYHLRRL